MQKLSTSLKHPLGATVQTSGGVGFCVWAPDHRQVEVVLEDGSTSMLTHTDDGYFTGVVTDARNGSLYRFRLDGGKTLVPDPASRFQPESPHGPSQVVDPSSYRWTDQDWRGLLLAGQVIYEMHIGTFTPEGTWEAARRELPELARVGITVLEIMPIADFPGRFGWGYDGVNLFAPTRLYGTPDDLRDFINTAHELGLGVILDVVYNHLGPDGNYLETFAKDYFTDRYQTDWGRAINYDGPNSGPVRDYFAANAAYWIREYHFDGLRLDATQNIYDDSADHILSVINRSMREAAGNRATIVVTENEPQDVRMVRPQEQGGHGFDGAWNDDFHHSARVALTGRSEAYLVDYTGSPQEFIAMAKRGFLYQGQYYSWQKHRRGTLTTGVPSSAFIVFLENHDQIANSGHGFRSSQLASPGRLRAMTALCLLMPGTPMLFQGQEFASSKPFLFFADHQSELAKLVHKGRREFLAQFPSLARAAMQERMDDPADVATWERCKLDFRERQTNAPMYALHQDLLRLRREDALFRAQDLGGVDGAVLGTHAFVLRYFGPNGDDRLLLINLGRDLDLVTVPEPLLAPSAGNTWQAIWTSEDPRYGGDAATAVDGEAGWHIPGEAAVVMKLGPAAAIHKTNEDDHCKR